MAPLILPVLLGFLIQGWSPPGSTPGDTTLRDDAGRMIETKAVATRVVALTPFAHETLEKIGVTPVAALKLPSTDRSEASGLRIEVDHANGPDLEALASAKPDLVVLDPSFVRFAPTIESKLGARVVCLAVSGKEDAVRDIRLLGRLVGKPDAAARVAARWIESFDSISDRQKVGDTGRVLILFGGGRAFYGYLPETYIGSLVDALGGEMVTADLPPHSTYRDLTPVTLEQILDLDPDSIVLLTHKPSEASFSVLESHPVWKSLRAVRQGQTRALSDELFVLRAGTELDIAFQELGAALRTP